MECHLLFTAVLSLPLLLPPCLCPFLLTIFFYFSFSLGDEDMPNDHSRSPLIAVPWCSARTVVIIGGNRLRFLPPSSLASFFCLVFIFLVVCCVDWRWLSFDAFFYRLLQNNSLTGTIPSWLGNFTSMDGLYAALPYAILWSSLSFSYKIKEKDVKKSLCDNILIWCRSLSNNNFSGSIPASLGYLELKAMYFPSLFLSVKMSLLSLSRLSPAVVVNLIPCNVEC